MNMTLDVIKLAVEAAGFSTTYDSDMERLICASMQRAQGDGLTGNSFWVTQRNGDWFLGTWAPRFYRVSEAERLPELCTLWLSRQPMSIAREADDYLQREFRLVKVRDIPD